HEVAAWTTAEVNFMDPARAVEIVHGVTARTDPERFAAGLSEMKKATSAFEYARVYGAHSVIDPRDTRGFLIDRLRIHFLRRSGGVGEHLMHSWPTSFC